MALLPSEFDIGGSLKHARIGTVVNITGVPRTSSGLQTYDFATSAVPTVSGFTLIGFALQSNNLNVTPLGVSYSNGSFKLFYNNGNTTSTTATVYAYPIYAET